jgi:hypothetical protein
MRYHEIASGFRVPVDMEEQQLLDAASSARLRAEDLSERELEVAQRMTSRGLLNRGRDDDGAFYVANSLADIWRF